VCIYKAIFSHGPKGVTEYDFMGKLYAFMQQSAIIYLKISSGIDEDAKV